MMNRPRFGREVVRRIPPRKQRDPSRLTVFVTLGGLALVGTTLCLTLITLTRPAGSSPATVIASLTPPPPAPTVAPATATLPPPPVDPTDTPQPAPSATPTRILTPAPTLLYTSQSGDTLPALAARFGVNPADIQAPQGLRGTTTLEEGQLLVIPRVLSEVGPGRKLIPDSELVFSGAATGFDPVLFAQQQGGYLPEYKWYAESLNRSGGDLLYLAAQNHSINPRLLMALLQYQSGWVTDPHPSGDALTYPMGYVHPYRKDLYSELNWAASQVAIGYYGWRAGTLTELRFPDGSTVRLDPTLNAGTVALQYFFAQTRNRPAWDEALGPQGFVATYQAFFGDPFAHALDPLIPSDLAQPTLALPFLRGHTWYFSGGPHGAWENGGAQAALDFAPASLTGGCAESQELVTAMAPGKIVRAGYGSVLLDLDGDGREATGWVILYLHIADRDQVKAGQFVEAGDPIGHPSCTGGQATGTHVHVARKYNGEWIPADSVIPFDLSGWLAHQGRGEYFGMLTRDGVTVEACTCTAAWTAITADQ